MPRKATQLYIKVFEDLWNKITLGYYKQGDQLPTEQEMESLYGVSKAPIKQALSKLEAAGIIMRQAGKGTFVTDLKPRSVPIESMGGFGSQYIYNWKELRCTTLAVETIVATESIAEALHLAAGEAVIHVARLRHEKEEPIFYLHHYVKESVDVDKIKSMGHFMSMRSLLDQELGLKDHYVNENVSIKNIDAMTGSMLALAEGTPVLFIKRYSYDALYEPFCYSEYYVKPDRWSYHVGYQRME